MTNRDTDRRETESLTLSVKEAAFAADVSTKAASQAIQRRLIRTRKLGRHADRSKRGVGPAEAVFLRVHSVLSTESRRQLYRQMHGKSLWDLPRRFEANDVTIDLTSAIERVAERIKTLEAMRERVAVDPEVRGGEPVFQGTRVPVHSVARKIELGASREELQEDHPQLRPEDLEMAVLFAELYPRQGRPRADWTHALERKPA
jgi:uncharacterized protein (DUF433 family)